MQSVDRYHYLSSLLNSVVPDLEGCALQFSAAHLDHGLACFIPSDDPRKFTIRFDTRMASHFADIRQVFPVCVHEVCHWIVAPTQREVVAHAKNGHHNLAWARACCHVTHRLRFDGVEIDPVLVRFTSDTLEDYECRSDSTKYMAATYYEAIECRNAPIRIVLELPVSEELRGLWLVDKYERLLAESPR